jgi:two-component system nitrogen regulation response regulator GlnG
MENNNCISNFFLKLFQENNFKFHHITQLHNFENYLSLNPDARDNCLILTNGVIENKDMFSYSIYVRRKFQLKLPTIAYTDTNIINNAMRSSQAGIEYFFALPVRPSDIVNCIHEIKNTLCPKDTISPQKNMHPIENNSCDKGISNLFKEYLDAYFSAHADFEPSSGLYERIMNEIEPQIILSSLKYTKGNRIKAADILGINRNTLRKKMVQYRIDLLNDS